MIKRHSGLKKGKKGRRIGRKRKEDRKEGRKRRILMLIQHNIGRDFLLLYYSCEKEGGVLYVDFLRAFLDCPRR